jgi:MOSC domain-containing protein YiiM
VHDSLQLTDQEILSGLSDIHNSPIDNGTIELIVIRPDSNERSVLSQCRLSPEGGTEGDAWARGCWKKLDDGSPHPDVQICITNSRMMRLLAGSKENWPPAGDNLFVDLNLSRDVLTAGQLLQVGDCILEITETSHNGCGKFAERYGDAALRVVNSEIGKHHRLRGVYARVVRAGVISVGDRIHRISKKAPLHS